MQGTGLGGWMCEETVPHCLVKFDCTIPMGKELRASRIAEIDP